MAIRRDTTSIRFAYPDTPEEEFQPQQQFMPEDIGMDELTRKLMSFGPEGPPPGFDPRAFKMTGMSKKPTPASAMVPEVFEPEPEEEHPYLPGEDYWAFTKRMDKVFKRGALDVPERGDPDFMPTMIDMYAKLPGSARKRFG